MVKYTPVVPINEYITDDCILSARALPFALAVQLHAPTQLLLHCDAISPTKFRNFHSGVPHLSSCFQYTEDSRGQGKCREQQPKHYPLENCEMIILCLTPSHKVDSGHCADATHRAIDGGRSHVERTQWGRVEKCTLHVLLWCRLWVLLRMLLNVLLLNVLLLNVLLRGILLGLWDAWCHSNWRFSRAIGRLSVITWGLF